MSQTALTIHDSATDAVAIVEQIANRNAGEQLQAERAIDTGNPIYFEALLQVLERENRKKSRRFAQFLTLFSIAGLIVSVAFDEFFHIKIGGMFGGLWMGLAGLAAYYAPTSLQKAAAAKVADSDDIRAVGPLVEALDKQDGATKKAAAKALTRLLPRLKYSDDLLDRRQLGYLREGFRKGHRDFKLAVLRALPQIGDERFLSRVAALANGKGAARRDVELRDAAVMCHEALKERIEEDKTTRLALLHPVESPDSNALLRPASGTNSDLDRLLRAVQPAETNPVQPL